MELELRVNGTVESLDAAPNESLLTLLRRNGYTEVKQGCETGACGTCTVLVDGVPKTSCVLLAAQAGGCTLTTVKGLGTANTPTPVQQAFATLGATGCGFCIPGMILSASALLKRNGQPTEDEIRDALSGNLCRCIGYEKPIEAVLNAASILRGEVPAEYANALNGARTTSKQRAVVLDGSNTVTSKRRALQITTPFTGVGSTPYSIIGKSVLPVDAVKKVMGRATFTDDDVPAGVLYAKILTSPRAHAVIRSIDASAARSMPGVHAVLTYEDVPRVPFASGSQTGPQDRYSLDYIVRYSGDRVAAVAAETPELAEQALERISVEYDVLPPLLHPRQALDSGNIRIHAESESRNIHDAERNVAARTRFETGDVERGFADADIVIENEYLTQMTRQASLEPHSVITYFDEDDYLVVRSNAYTPHNLRRQLSTILGIPIRCIRVEQPTLGNPTAGQSLVSEDICALLTQATHRPVRLVYSRAEELRDIGSPQHIVRVKTGVRSDGSLVAQQMLVLTSTGAYGTYTPTSQNVLSLYSCPHTRFVAEVLYTNLPPASNTPGASAELFALESHMDEVAKQLHMDALAFRRKNWGRGETPSTASRTVQECLQLVEAKLQWGAKRGQTLNSRLHRGVGIALTRFDNTLPNAESSGASVKLNEDGSFDVFVSVADPALKTMLVQIAAEVLDVSVDEIVLHTSTTDTIPVGTTTEQASTLYNAGAALHRAAEQVRRQMLIVASRLLGNIPENLTIREGVVTPSPLNGHTLTLAQIATHLLTNEGKQLLTNAFWKETSPPVAHAVHGAEVEVNIDTGEVRVIKLLAALDAGRVIHPALTEAQVQGSIVRGLGFSQSEEVLYDTEGYILAKTLDEYHLCNATEMPELQTYLLQDEEASNAVFGAKSVVEVAQSGVAPAISNAVADALGLSIRQLPLTPERILRALHAKDAKHA